MPNIQEPKGVCFFAYNNEQIDYVELATLAALYVKEYLDLPVCLITDEGTDYWLKESKPTGLIKHCFDYIVITNDDMKSNPRRHFDSPWSEFQAQFSNSNKHKVWEYSPFEQTLLLDIDYIVKSNFLLDGFENHGVTMFNTARDLRNDMPMMREQYLYEAGIKMWWSTVIAFDRSEESKLFFDTWSHIADNYAFYQYLYNFPPKLFRTDYCVSIAAHILNGMTDGDAISTFNGPMFNLNQKDDLIEVQSINDWIMLSNDSREPWKNILVKDSNLDLHVMNKRALGRMYNKLVEFFVE